MFGFEMALAAVLLSDDPIRETWDVACPDNARAAVSHDGDAVWTATTQSSGVQSLSIETLGGSQVLVCHYQMFGTDYWIWRRPPTEVPFCSVLQQPAASGGRGIFSCHNNGRRDP